MLISADETNPCETSQDASSIFALDDHIGELGCIERQMDTKIRPCLAGNLASAEWK